jgi:hypothetical protein
MSNNICIHCDRRIKYNDHWNCYETTIGGDLRCEGNDRGHADLNGNAVLQDGVDVCPCGCKYWENDICIDCGGTVPEPDNSPEAVAARQRMFKSFGW